MGTISPLTPSKKRYSCVSEYGTPRGSDDSDSSMYYSFVSSEEENNVNKENSGSGGQWTVSESSSSPASRATKAKTPLLKKVLQTNFTPRNKNNKRVSFSQSTKPCPTPEADRKIPKTQWKSEPNTIDLNTITESATTSKSVTGILNWQESETVIEIGNIVENLPHGMQVEDNESETVKEIGSIVENLPHGMQVEDNTPIVNVEDILNMDHATIEEEHSTTVASDDLENDLHNTIIENPPNLANVTLTLSCDDLASPDETSANENENVPIELEKEIESAPLQPKLPSPQPSMSAVVKEKTPPTTTTAKLSLADKRSTPSCPIPKVPSPGSANVKTLQEILAEANKPKPPNRTVAIKERQRFVSDSRKSILPVAKSYKRRSSTYEPRKVDARKSLGVLKHVASRLQKTITEDKKQTKTTSRLTMAAPASVAPVLRARPSVAMKVNPVPGTSKVNTTRTTISNPSLPIMSTRQTTSSVRTKRRETTVLKHNLTTQALVNRSSKTPAAAVGPTTSSSSSSGISASMQALVNRSAKKPAAAVGPSTSSSGILSSAKPIDTTIRKASVTTNTTVPVPTNGGNCQYCGKYFAKSHGMTTHLLEMCEKIPAATRRRLLKNDKPIEETNSKQVSRRKTHVFGQENDSISKYSRFFMNMSNASGMQNGGGGGVATNDVENGLKHLRAELRKVKSAHTGIARTPSKSIRCHICRKMFLDCVEYADHISNHPPLNN